jgi:hypothetical protein
MSNASNRTLVGLLDALGSIGDDIPIPEEKDVRCVICKKKKKCKFDGVHEGGTDEGEWTCSFICFHHKQEKIRASTKK